MHLLYATRAIARNNGRGSDQSTLRMLYRFTNFSGVCIGPSEHLIKRESEQKPEARRSRHHTSWAYRPRLVSLRPHGMEKIAASKEGPSD